MEKNNCKSNQSTKHLRNNNTKKYKKFYNDKTKNIISQHFEKEIEYFNYSF